MQTRPNTRFFHKTTTDAAAFVICPASVFMGGSPRLALPRLAYAYAFEQANRLVAQQAYWRLRASHLNLN